MPPTCIEIDSHKEYVEEVLDSRQGTEDWNILSISVLWHRRAHMDAVNKFSQCTSKGIGISLTIS